MENKIILPSEERREILIEWKQAPRIRLYQDPDTIEHFRERMRAEHGHQIGFMPSPGYQSTLIESQVDGTAGTSTTENSIIPAAAKYTMLANYLDKIGKRLHIHASGRVSNIVTTPGNITFRFKMGPTANIAVATSTARNLNIVAKTTVGWDLEWYLTLRALGAATTANFMHNGVWTSESVIGSPAGAAGSATLQDTPVVGTGFDSTVANVCDLTAQFSLTGNSITCHNYSLESLN